MRFGELAELRRSDIDVKNGEIRVRISRCSPREVRCRGRSRNSERHTYKRKIETPPFASA